MLRRSVNDGGHAAAMRGAACASNHATPWGSRARERAVCAGASPTCGVGQKAGSLGGKEQRLRLAHVRRVALTAAPEDYLPARGAHAQRQQQRDAEGVARRDHHRHYVTVLM